MDEFNSLIFKLAFIIPLLSSIFNIINDCDETYNYWEPLHFLVTDGQGNGFQTWEYSPTYSLRSYTYLWFFGWPAYLLIKCNFPSWLGFLAVRFYLGLFSAFTAAYLALTVKKYVFASDKYKGSLFSIIFTILFVFSPGNFLSSTSLVPSSQCVPFVSLMLAFWIRKCYFLSIGCVAFMGINLWPFASVFGLPLALHLLINRKIKTLLVSSIAWAITLLAPTIAIDSLYYGRFSITCLNIIKYNILSNGMFQKSLSQLYGVEDVTFYLKNYLLNHNISFIFALLAVIPLPFVILKFIFNVKSKSGKCDSENFCKLYFMACACLLLWNGIFFLQSHKEERFLYPCYPCHALVSSSFIFVLFNIVNSIKFKKLRIFLQVVFILLIFLSFLLLSGSRVFNLVRWYNAPIYLIKHLPQPTKSSTVCLARDWHHFPTRFILPGNSSLWHVQFLQSNFSGQLPGHFKPVSQSGSVLLSTSTDGSRFNAENREENDRYPEAGDSVCDFIFDRDSATSSRETLFVSDNVRWSSFVNRSILEPRKCDNQKLSHVLCTFLRSFYVPIISENVNNQVRMHILSRN